MLAKATIHRLVLDYLVLDCRVLNRVEIDGHTIDSLQASMPSANRVVNVTLPPGLFQTYIDLAAEIDMFLITVRTEATESKG